LIPGDKNVEQGKAENGVVALVFERAVLSIERQKHNFSKVQPLFHLRLTQK
jgi:hypothetical protein